MSDIVSFRARSALLIAFIFAASALILSLDLSDRPGATGAAAVPSASLSPSHLDKIAPEVLEDTADGKSTSFVVLMDEQAGLNAAYQMSDEDARGWYVYNTLTSTADRTQADVRAILSARGVAYRVLWIANALAVTGDRTLVEEIAALPEVRKIASNRPSTGIDPIAPSKQVRGDSPQAVEWGVQRVNAPQLWAMGYTGQGILVGNADTGMRWTHNAIKSHYRGWDGATADHNYNWWDAIRSPTINPCGWASSQPCDDDEILGGGHGTHTTGTAVGDDGAGNQVGVAPGAKWIGCRNMERGVGTLAYYLDCFQFFLAPHDLSDQDPDPTRRPHVLNNSWACVEGCAPDALRSAVEASQAAGIFVEASAGNDGPECSTVAFPPAIYEATFSTGAIDITNAIADFSSRGPVLSDASSRLKPNVSAPGVDVRSSLRGSDTEYGELSGTSMAGPHVVGVVALLWSARPDLSRRITETKTLLQQSANPSVTVNPVQTCGGTPSNQAPNNSFGWGRVDVLAAYNLAQATVTPMPTVTPVPTSTATTVPTDALVGHVTWQGRPAQPNPLQRLPVTLTLKSALAGEINYTTRTSDASGFFTVSVGGLLPGVYNWRTKGAKYLATSGTVVIGPGTNQQEMGLMRAGDCNNDNVVNIQDFNLMKATFGRAAGDPFYDDHAEYTGDNVVNILDFNLLKPNFGTGGAPPVSPGGR